MGRIVGKYGRVEMGVKGMVAGKGRERVGKEKNVQGWGKEGGRDGRLQMGRVREGVLEEGGG